jgi:hypothetical protein
MDGLSPWLLLPHSMPRAGREVVKPKQPEELSDPSGYRTKGRKDSKSQNSSPSSTSATRTGGQR